MANKKGLGRGLSALLSGDDIDSFNPEKKEKSLPKQSLTSSGDIVQVPVDKLLSNPDQPRKHFDKNELQELADSITEHGIIQPIIAMPSSDNKNGEETYIIIAGERRTRAAKMAGLRKVPVIIRKYSDQKRMEVSLIENIQRSDLNPIEEAAAYKNYMDKYDVSQEEVAIKAGKPRSTIANALRLLKLSADIQKSLEEKTIFPGHGRALLSVTDKKSRDKLYKEITAKDLSVREAEKRAAALNQPENTDDEKPVKRPPEITEMEEKFMEKLGTKVVIDGNLEKGRIHIDYYSMEDLDRLYEILGK